MKTLVENMLILFLLVLVTPLAFLLMPVFAALIILGAIVTLILTSGKHDDVMHSH